MTAQTVLIIDDDEVFRILLKRWLGKTNCRVTEAESGEDGLKSISQRIPDLIIADFLLPDMDGDELIPKIREIAADTPVIGMSGATRFFDAAEELGVRHVLDKAIDQDDFLCIIGKLLDASN